MKRRSVLTVLFGIALLSPGASFADGPLSSAPDSGIQAAASAQPSSDAASDTDSNTSDDTSDAPVRMARVTRVYKNVWWRPDDSSDWSEATLNLPLRQGAQLWVHDEGRTEIQFDDGGILRLTRDAVVTLQTMYSDADGEFTQLTQSSGYIYLNTADVQSAYQVDTPLVSIKAAPRSKLRIGAEASEELTVYQGQLTLSGAQGTAVMNANDFMRVPDATTPFRTSPKPPTGPLEKWSWQRDEVAQLTVSAASQDYMPPEVALTAGDLDSYGDWQTDAQYGHVWMPRVTQALWRPYAYGHWVWVAPLGWTWVSSEPWGWAPYHYGTWIHTAHGWAWVPGPAGQYWSPAMVSFKVLNGVIAWCPLAPEEVLYPASLSVGHLGKLWSKSFSIGGVACYFPGPGHMCRPYAWKSEHANGSRTNVDGAAMEEIIIDRQFVPRNSAVDGATVSSVEGFGGHGPYRLADLNDGDIFVHGSVPAAMHGEQGPLAGPAEIRPTAISFTSTRKPAHKVQLPPDIAGRHIFHMPLPAAIQTIEADARIEHAIDKPSHEAATPKPAKMVTPPPKSAISHHFDPPRVHVGPMVAPPKAHGIRAVAPNHAVIRPSGHGALVPEFSRNSRRRTHRA